MIAETRVPMHPNTGSRGLRATVVLAVVALAAAGAFRTDVLSSAATFTDTQTTTAAEVSSGTLQLAVDDGAQSGSWTGAVSLVPGQSQYAGVRILNSGTVRMRYSVSALSSSELAASLETGVAVLAAATTTCTSSTFAQGSLASATGLPFGSSPELDLIGSSAAGNQAGDRILSAGSSERLCLRVTFPTGTGLGAAARGTSAATTFTVTAESA